MTLLLWSPWCRPSVEPAVDQVKEEQEKEVPEYKAILWDTLKELEAARKFVYEFCVEDDLVLMCNRFENELYRLSIQTQQNTCWLVK